MCVVLLMLPFVGRAQQQKVTVRVSKAGVQEVFRQIISGESIRVHLREFNCRDKKTGYRSSETGRSGYPGSRVRSRREHDSGGVCRVEGNHIGYGVGCGREVRACLTLAGWRGADIHVYRDEDTGNSREGCEDVERYLGGGFRDDSRSGGDRNLFP